MSIHVDFNETAANRKIMSILLSEYTSGKNILWCTDDYLKHDKGYSSNNEILIEMISGDKHDVIRPRASKLNSEQRQRSKDMAEVFTPSWICHKQNNLIDNSWFGYVGAFNKEKQKTWVVTDKVVFPYVSLGSVNFFLYDLQHDNGLTMFYEDGKTNYVERPLFEHGLDIIFSMNSMSDIVNKVLSIKNFESLKLHAKGRNAFGISGKKETVEKETSASPFKGSVEVRCAHEVIRYIEKSKITKNVDIMEHYKISTSKGNGAAGTLDVNSANYIIGKAYVGKSNSICTDSLIPIGCFNSEEEAINLQTYMKTKFLRYLVGAMKSSRNIHQVVYEFVPVQDFTSKSDIDWTKSIVGIYKQLYKKYKFSNEEINLVESIIKPME